ncbi:hypothetical protein B0H16DRAFT_1713022 [Mycena metata]|uniref:Uncharacterized protein n=1 Tax=Mycena metata TaxID=1033252 RepID=A0AAD7K071_9AGAR|nr:hypothetical protein B0H16DRAFT_1713022 [Mycena metata]
MTEGWIFTVAALSRVWQTFEFSTPEFLRLARCTVSIALREHHNHSVFDNRIPPAISSDLRRIFSRSLGESLIQAARRVRDGSVTSGETVIPDRALERVTEFMDVLGAKISTEFEPNGGEVTLGGEPRRYDHCPPQPVRPTASDLPVDAIPQSPRPALVTPTRANPLRPLTPNRPSASHPTPSGPVARPPSTSTRVKHNPSRSLLPPSVPSARLVPSPTYDLDCSQSSSSPPRPQPPISPPPHPPPATHTCATRYTRRSLGPSRSATAAPTYGSLGKAAVEYSMEWVKTRCVLAFVIAPLAPPYVPPPPPTAAWLLFSLLDSRALCLVPCAR